MKCHEYYFYSLYPLTENDILNKKQHYVIKTFNNIQEMLDNESNEETYLIPWGFMPSNIDEFLIATLEHPKMRLILYNFIRASENYPESVFVELVNAPSVYINYVIKNCKEIDWNFLHNILIPLLKLFIKSGYIISEEYVIEFLKNDYLRELVSLVIERGFITYDLNILSKYVTNEDTVLSLILMQYDSKFEKEFLQKILIKHNKFGLNRLETLYEFFEIKIRDSIYNETVTLLYYLFFSDLPIVKKFVFEILEYITLPSNLVYVTPNTEKTYFHIIAKSKFINDFIDLFKLNKYLLYIKDGWNRTVLYYILNNDEYLEDIQLTQDDFYEKISEYGDTVAHVCAKTGKHIKDMLKIPRVFTLINNDDESVFYTFLSNFSNKYLNTPEFLNLLKMSPMLCFLGSGTQFFCLKKILKYDIYNVFLFYIIKNKKLMIRIFKSYPDLFSKIVSKTMFVTLDKDILLETNILDIYMTDLKLFSIFKYFINLKNIKLDKRILLKEVANDYKYFIFFLVANEVYNFSNCPPEFLPLKDEYGVTLFCRLYEIYEEVPYCYEIYKYNLMNSFVFKNYVRNKKKHMKNFKITEINYKSFKFKVKDTSYELFFDGGN